VTENFINGDVQEVVDRRHVLAGTSLFSPSSLHSSVVGGCGRVAAEYSVL